jgi:hypothetical protein
MIALFVFAILVGGIVSPLHAEPKRQTGQEPVTNVAEIPPQPPNASVGLSLLLDQVDETRLMAHIAALESVGTRHVNSSYTDPTRGIGAAYNYILSQFQAISRDSEGNFAVWTDYFTLDAFGHRSTARNVVGVIGDTDYGSGTIIIGAHYDSRCSKLDDYLADAPGADDNASGVAALIELARILSAHPHRVRIILVAFSAEEVWTTNTHGELRGSGSMAFVREFVQANHVNVKAMINLDMIGSSGPDGQHHDHEIRLFSAGPADSVSRQLAWQIYDLGAVYVPEMQILVQENGDREGRYGDQLSFSDAGYPAVRFIEPMEDREHQHNDGDTIDRIEPEYLTEVTRCLLAIISVMADQS